MTEEQIIEIIGAPGHPAFAGRMTDLVGLYASRLATVSDRLTPQELAEFISIGVALYQKGFREYASEMKNDE